MYQGCPRPETDDTYVKNHQHIDLRILHNYRVFLDQINSIGVINEILIKLKDPVYVLFLAEFDLRTAVLFHVSIP